MSRRAAARHTPNGDRRSAAYRRAREAKAEGFRFTSTFSLYPTSDDRADLDEAFGVESTRAFHSRVTFRSNP